MERSSVFAWGVASGDPTPDGATLWTRVAPGPGTEVPVRWRVAADPAMRDTIATGHAVARAADDWTVHVRLRDGRLSPDAFHWYRFEAVGQASRTGRLRTLPTPDASPRRLRLGYVSCQDYTAGWFGALRALGDTDVDLVAHLGDAIYESVGDSSFQRRGPATRTLRLPSGRPRAETLDDYRWLYRTYRSDPDLQHLLARHTLLPIWDDHEFANDGYGVHDTDTDDPAANADPARRSAASRAWVEYQPTDVDFDPDAEPVEQLRIWRRFRYGDLAEIVMTDERLYRDGPPCGPRRRDRYATFGCAEMLAEDRTMLGATQRRWLTDTLASSTRRWKLWANETMVMPLRLPGWLARWLHPEAAPDVPMLDDVLLNLDQWDGYQWERALVTEALRDVDGLVVLTGDLHSFIAGTLRTASGDPVAPCLMTGSVTSANLAELLARRTLPSLPVPLTWLLRGANPHLAFVNSSAHGFTVLDITPDRVRCHMRAVMSTRGRRSWTWPVRSFTVEHGQRALRR